MYNYNHLYYFYITVKSGGVTSAAKNLHISQPSLSGQLKVLEEYLQTKLFKKIGRKNELTTEGALIYGFCRQMFELSEEMHESITDRLPYASRRIHVGVSNEIAHSFVVEVISDFLSKYNKKLRPIVTMISGSDKKISEQLMFREIDVAVTSLSMTHPELENLKCIDVPVYLISHSEIKKSLVKKPLNIDTALKVLEEDGIHQWVMPSQGFKLRSEINNFFEKKQIKGRIVFESDVIESLARSVIDNIGLAFLPLIYIPKEIKNKSLYYIGPPKGYWKHQICIASHIKNKEDEFIKSLSSSFKNVCNSQF